MIRRIVLAHLGLFFCLLGGTAPGKGIAAQSQSIERTPVMDEGSFAFEELAKEVLEDLGASSDQTFQNVLLGTGFGRAEIGAFDVFIPKEALVDHTELDLVKEATLALLDVQAVWYSWRGAPGDGGAFPDEADWKILRKFVEGWSTSKFVGLSGASESLSVQLSAKGKLLEAQARLRQATANPPETAQAIGERRFLLLEPSRESFLRHVALAGLLVTPDRPILWTDTVLKQTACWAGWTQIVSLVGIAYPFDANLPYQQSSLTKDDSTGLAQFVAERGAAQILRTLLYLHGTGFFEEALMTDLVIATVGRNNLNLGDWMFEMHREGGSTRPYSRFVPGGNPNGGVLPPRKASSGPTTTTGTYMSSYRKDRGEGYFLGVLREGQKVGAKLASKDRENPLRKNKLAHFAVHSVDPIEDGYVSAPFLGRNTEGKKLPALGFLDDYEDFFRAYRACFMYWLRDHGEGNKQESREHFRDLIVKHAAREIDTPLYEVVDQVYSVPMSSKDPEADSLEWRFLKWLSKGR